MNNIDVLQNPIRLLISPIEVESKDNAGKVKNSFFGRYAITSVPDLETLAEYLLTGHAITPAYLLPNSDNIDARTEKPHTAPTNKSIFVSQQVFGVDLDNHETEISENGKVKYPEGVDKTMTLSSILDFCNGHQLRPFLIYETMSSTDDCLRYRVLFCTPDAVTDSDVRSKYVVAIRDLFATRFRYTDKKVTDLSRFYYGTTRHDDDQYYFESVTCDLDHIVAERLNEDTVGTNLNINIKPLSKYQGKYLPYLDSMSNPVERTGDIYHQAARVPFELFSHHSLTEGHFRCEAEDHVDNNPSAHIYIDDKGEYRYHCFGCKVDMSGVDYVMMTQRLSLSEALKVVLKSRHEVKPLRKLRQGLRRLWKDNRTAYSKLYFHANSGADILQVCVDMAETGYVDGDEVVFIAPASLIRQRLKDIHVDRQEDSIRRTMKKLCAYGGFLRHVSDDELRERYPKMLDYLKQIQGPKCSTHCSVYAMSLNRSFEECLQICLESETNRRTSGATGAVTQDSTRLQGADVQESLYQATRGISDEMVRLLKRFRPALKKCLEDLNYATRDLVLKYSGESSNRSQRKLREAWPRLLQDEGLMEIRVNRSNRLEYGLPAEIDSNSKVAVRKEGVVDGRCVEVSGAEESGDGVGEIGEGGGFSCADAIACSDSVGGGEKARSRLLAAKIQAHARRGCGCD